jgi:NDP-sugar pyrophosphorylase family protein
MPVPDSPERDQQLEVTTMVPTRAVVLAGGRGTRLAPYTTVFPKPLVPIGGMPILEIVLRQLRWYGVREVILSVGYLSQLIEAYFATRGPIPGLTITYLRESQPLGTAGALALLGNVDDNLLVVNGDILTTLDFGKMIEFHLSNKPAITIASYRKAVKIDLGVLNVDPSSSIVGYDEKPVLHYLCSMGIYMYSRRALESIAVGEPLDFPSLVLRMLGQGETALAYQSDCYWLDIGRHDDYERAMEEFSRMRGAFLPDEVATNGKSEPVREHAGNGRP